MKKQDSFKRGDAPTLIIAIIVGAIVGITKFFVNPKVELYHLIKGSYGLNLLVNILFIAISLIVFYGVIIALRRGIFRILYKRKMRGNLFHIQIEECGYKQYCCVDFIPYVIVEIVCTVIALMFSDTVFFENVVLVLTVNTTLIVADGIHFISLRRPEENETICDDGINVKVVEKK